MNVPRRLIGKMVEIQWMDPSEATREDCDKSLKGRTALATWLERGVIVDITDGVVKVEHSICANAGKTMAEPSEHTCTSLHEALIESIATFTKDQEPGHDRVPSTA